MISVVTNERCFEFRGLSTDTKPINSLIGNGSTFFEIDTCKVFMFNEEKQKWVELQ